MITRGVGVVIAKGPAAEVERQHPEARRIAFRQLGEVARISGQSGQAQQRRPVGAARIIAIMELQPVADRPLPVLVALCANRIVHAPRPLRSRRPVTLAMCSASALDHTSNFNPKNTLAPIDAQAMMSRSRSDRSD